MRWSQRTGEPSLAAPSPYIHWLAVGAAYLTVGLTAVTFWLSYAALHDLAATHHLRGARAWAWPATIDAFIVVGELLILRASLLRQLDWFAMFLVGSGSTASIALNVVSVGHVDTTVRVVAAVPPVAALLAFSALMRQIYRALTTSPAAAPVVADVDPQTEPQEVLVVEEEPAEAVEEPLPEEANVLTLGTKDDLRSLARQHVVDWKAADRQWSEFPGAAFHKKLMALHEAGGPEPPTHKWAGVLVKEAWTDLYGDPVLQRQKTLTN
jgi:hypothetical protein